MHPPLPQGDRAADRDREQRRGEAEGSYHFPGAASAVGQCPHPTLPRKWGTVNACGWCDDTGPGRPVKHGRVEHGVDLRVFLEYGLKQGHVHPRVVVIGGRARRDFGNRAAEDEGVEQLVRNQLAGAVIILGPPGGGDLGPQLGIESRAFHGDVAQDRHHVDDKRLALGAIERLAPAVIDQAEQVAAEIDIAGRPSVGRRRFEDAGAHLLVGGEGFGGPAQVTVRLQAAEVEEGRAIGGDIDRNPVRRLKHRLQRRHLVVESQRFAPPELADLVDRFRDPRYGVVIWDGHLRETEWQTATQR